MYIISYILFANPVTASSIIISPQSWNKSIALRADILINFVPRTTAYVNIPLINGVISPPVVIPTIPLEDKYISDNTDISDSLNNSYESIKNARNSNLDNQDRIDKLDKRIKKIQKDIIGITKSTAKNSNIKAPKFY